MMADALRKIAGIEIDNAADISTSIQVAALALKHRQNKNQRQRIVLFVGSPVDLKPENMEEIGVLLKKNNVSIDIIAFGEASSEESQATLKMLLDAANSSDNCHMVVLYRALQSPISFRQVSVHSL